MSSIESLHGTRAVITGATSGLGRTMAAALAEAGAMVAVTSRSTERAEQTARELGPNVVGLASDVREEDSVARLVEEVQRRFGGIDLLVNNAEVRARLLDPAIMGPPITWLASDAAAGVHNERIIATEFEDWLARYPRVSEEQGS
ncbi:SDR family NAD(P)-dependent oxidoreductase [Nocardia sp. SYP-A9097]|uniref:SDR family NAD(P)-dependent oxidoreductase n=1 Tax=Nocardia sp. SYP-A9097 TaxID=2663237 RepID=UPI00129AB019|nr:SDR family NAD(P)-dependent oxidoreductase [Nocardia sp. SYP-A9097]MRH87545.1 SDR family NAD(P)-dependent oxidoreductase [Nocardia sp. SYP-A9097]